MRHKRPKDRTKRTVTKFAWLPTTVFDYNPETQELDEYLIWLESYECELVYNIDNNRWYTSFTYYKPHGSYPSLRLIKPKP